MNIRLLAATHRDLAGMVATGAFREGLYYRLHVVSIRLPPLRERKQDIPLLTQFLLRRSGECFGIPPPPLAPGEMERLLAYHWPGNVRELQNVLEEALVCGGSLPLKMWADRTVGWPEPGSVPTPLTFDAMARTYLQNLLKATHGRIAGKNGAAEQANLNVSTFRFRCKRLGIALGPPR